MKDEIWTTKDGKEIEVKDLTESHAKNIIRYLIRNSLIDMSDHLPEWADCYNGDIEWWKS